jgi:hypothetical protein
LKTLHRMEDFLSGKRPITKVRLEPRGPPGYVLSHIGDGAATCPYLVVVQRSVRTCLCSHRALSFGVSS